MQHEAELFSQLREHVRTTGFNDSNGLWQTVAHRQEVESFCPPKELAFTLCCEQFESETGFRRPTLSGPFDASVMPRFERPAVTFSGKTESDLAVRYGAGSSSESVRTRKMTWPVELCNSQISTRNRD